MKTHANGVVCALFLLFFLPIVTHADNWPVFSPPSEEQIVTKISTSDCAPGQAKIPMGTQFPITIFHTTWYWDYQGKEQCLSISSLLNSIHYVSFQQTGHETGSTVSAGYGPSAQQILFRFEFKIPACSDDGTCRWFCGPTTADELPAYIGCAYDE